MGACGSMESRGLRIPRTDMPHRARALKKTPILSSSLLPKTAPLCNGIPTALARGVRLHFVGRTGGSLKSSGLGDGQTLEAGRRTINVQPSPRPTGLEAATRRSVSTPRNLVAHRPHDAVALRRGTPGLSRRPNPGNGFVLHIFPSSRKPRPTRLRLELGLFRTIGPLGRPRPSSPAAGGDIGFVSHLSLCRDPALPKPGRIGFVLYNCAASHTLVAPSPAAPPGIGFVLHNRPPGPLPTPANWLPSA
jgi:hypothetical protein